MIKSAYLQVYSAQDQWIDMNFNIAGEATGNSLLFSSLSLPSQRTLTTAKIAHSSSNRWLIDTWYPLDDISLVIQEIVSRADWSSTNSLSIILKGTAGPWARKFVQSFDGSALNAPRLVVTYQ